MSASKLSKLLSLCIYTCAKLRRLSEDVACVRSTNLHWHTCVKYDVRGTHSDLTGLAAAEGQGCRATLNM